MTRQQAINAKCRDCIYDECAPGNWRQQVTACTITSCSLWPYRPKSKGKVKSDGVLPPQSITTEKAEGMAV